MEVIDEGGYGCVIRPPLNCKNEKPTSNKMVSKLQLKKHAEYEMRQINKVKKLCKKIIPNCEKYAILEAKICDPIIPTNIDSSRKNKCSHLETGLDVSSYLSNTKNKSLKTKKSTLKKNLFKIINLPDMGINLHKYILNNSDFSNPETFIKLNNSIIGIYQNFILPLNKNNFYHNDIKTLNIVVDERENCRIIDYGISNQIIFSHKFSFNNPYMYILLSNYFLDKIETLKKREKLTYERVKELLINYLDLIKLKTSSHYVYTNAILEFLYPEVTTRPDEINQVLLECLIQTAMRYKTTKEWIDIYINNLDIVGIAMIYPDILCGMDIKKQMNPRLQQGIIYFYTKYVTECFSKINPTEFIDDLNKLNLLVI